MSYGIKLTERVVEKLKGWHVSKQEVREIRQGLEKMASNPTRLLMRVGPPHDALQYDLAVTDAGTPRRDALYTFTIRYGADEQTLYVVDCELTVEYRAP